MGCLLVSGVLIVTLMFSFPAAQEESSGDEPSDEENVMFEEFCLKISKYSVWTIPEPKHIQGVASANEERGMVERNGCYCNSWQKHTADRSLIRSIEFRLPAPHGCNNTEIIETLVEGTKVCVNDSSTSYFTSLFGPLSDPTKEETTTHSPDTPIVSLSPNTHAEEPRRMNSKWESSTADLTPLPPRSQSYGSTESPVYPGTSGEPGLPEPEGHPGLQGTSGERGPPEPEGHPSQQGPSREQGPPEPEGHSNIQGPIRELRHPEPEVYFSLQEPSRVLEPPEPEVYFSLQEPSRELVPPEIEEHPWLPEPPGAPRTLGPPDPHGPQDPPRAPRPPGPPGSVDYCLCTKKLDGLNPRLLSRITLRPSSPYCRVLEIIVSLKDGTRVCLDPNAAMVKTLLKMLGQNPVTQNPPE
ncbi:EMI domain-containing protein 1 isoform X1 [Esox lucius]|uniref:EMI domain-containing protein 1 isoform X1 n=1 Tax=Esox lucius TaxID=8010 RepID=UPI00147744D1|nr:EMI domain-containing protein 1 isoform X1 [Esox lucius]